MLRRAETFVCEAAIVTLTAVRMETVFTPPSASCHGCLSAVKPMVW